MRGRALQLVKAVEDSNGLDAWRSLSKALKPTSKARGLEVEASPELMRTTLVKRGGRWLMPEYFESMMKKEQLDEQFFDDDAVIPSITVFSYEAAPPEDRGFFAQGYKELENREQRKTDAQKTIVEIAPIVPRRRR